MDNIDEEFEKYYRFTSRQLQQRQQQQQQVQSSQAPQQQQQPIHSITADFNQESLFDLLPPNEYYNTNVAPTTGQFSTNNDELLNQDEDYKHQSDQSLYMNQIMPNSDNRMAHSAASTSQFMPSNNNDHLSAAAEDQNNNFIYNNTTDNNITNNSYMFSQHGIQNDGNVMFEQSQKHLMTHSNNFQTPSASNPSRQEQDVFNELISLATRNNSNSQPDMSSWQSHVTNANAIPYTTHTNSFHAPPPSTAEFQRQIEQQRYNTKNYFNPTTNTTNNASSSSASSSTTRLAQQTATTTISTTKRPTIDDDGSTNSHNSSDRVYELIIAQQPSRARMCGFGDKDRRPISPPPILQLIVTTKHGQIINPETFDASFLVAMCDSCQDNESIIEGGTFQQDDATMTTSSSQVVSFPTITTNEEGIETNTAIKMRNLVGSSVSSATKLYDLDGNLGIFFVFQDVSLRTEGCFRLKFSLVDIGSPYSHNVNTTSVSQVLKAIHTDPFIVYTAKKFPGVVQSTPLSKCFAKQGIKIPIRKEKTMSATAKKRRAAAASRNNQKFNSDLEEEDEEEDQDDEV